ncbi:MAG: TatD family hydrolase [Candidatus Sericytochromatia bacterium]
MFFDSHAHINLPHYDNDRNEVIEKIFSLGVEKILIPAVDKETIESSLALSEKYPNNIFSSVGYHPQDAIKWEENSLDFLKSYAKNNNAVKAIGEIGLDYYWDTTPKEKQHEVFKIQIELAKELNLPLIIHTRDSLEDTIELLEENEANKVGGVFHCFSGDLAFAERCLRLGFYISFAGNITFKNANNLREVAKNIPLDKILIETDSPYLTPMPDRGKRNDPSYVIKVANQIAELKGLTVEEVAKQTFINAEKLFKIS